MKEMMQKALDAIVHRKTGHAAERRPSGDRGQVAPHREDWGMSPEDALRVGTVAQYK